MKTVFNQIISTLQNHYGNRVANIAAYSPFVDQKIITPAILIELEDINEGDDLGDGYDPQQLSFKLHCILSCQTKDVEIMIASFASETLQVIRQQNFGIKNGRLTQNISAMPGDFNPAKKGYESWHVNFSLTVNLGVGDFNKGLEINPSEIEIITRGLGLN